MDLLYEIEEESIDKNRLDVFFIGQSGYILKTNECIIYIDPYLSDYIENPNGLSDKYMCRNYPSPIDPKKIKKIATQLFVPTPMWITWIPGRSTK